MATIYTTVKETECNTTKLLLQIKLSYDVTILTFNNGNFIDLQK